MCDRKPTLVTPMRTLRTLPTLLLLAILMLSPATVIAVPTAATTTATTTDPTRSVDPFGTPFAATSAPRASESGMFSLTEAIHIVPGAPGGRTIGGRAVVDENTGGDTSPAGAALINGGDTFVGSFLISDPADVIDAVLFEVPFGTAVNITIYMLDWNPADYTAYNVDFIFGVNIANLNTPGWSSNLNTARNETGTLLGAQDAVQFAVLMGVPLDAGNNPLSLPVDYALTVTFTDPPQVGAGSTSFTISNQSSNRFQWFKLADGSDAPLHLVITPATGQDLDADVYNPWARWGLYEGEMTPFWLDRLNAAAVSQPESANLIGGDGQVFIQIRAAAGAGQGTLAITSSSAITSDDDNRPATAHVVTETVTFDDQLHEMEDHWDWYKVPVETGDNFSVLFSPQGIAASHLFNISLYDNDLNFLEGKFNTQDRGLFDATTNPIVVSPVTWDDYVSSCTCDYYLVVFPVTWIDPGAGGGYRWEDVLSGEYFLKVTIPNEGPALSSSIPDITIDEDEELVDYNITGFFTDPETNALDFAVSVSGASVDEVDVSIDAQAGTLSVVPEQDWSGSFALTITATDPKANIGANFVQEQVSVTVDPVNDAPQIDQPLGAMSFGEDTPGPGLSYPFSLRLVDIFHDIDTDAADMDFTWSGNLRIPVALNESGGVGTEYLMIGPVSGWFGTETVTFTVSDGEFEDSFVTTMTVNHINHDPVVVPGKETISVTVPEDLEGKSSVFVVNDIKALFSDLDTADPGYAAMTGDSLTIAIDDARLPENFNVSLSGSKVELSDLRTDWTQGESFYLQAYDVLEQPVFVEVEVGVTPINDAPTLVSSLPVPQDNGTRIVLREGERKSFSVSVADVDNIANQLTHTWTLDDLPVGNSRESSYDLVTDQDSHTDTLSAGDYVLRVRIADPEGETIEHLWDISILDVNRPPTKVAILMPKAPASFKEGTDVDLRAGDAVDADEDPLTYHWELVLTDGNVSSLGEGQALTVSDLPVGSHTLRLVVSDSKEGGDANTTMPLTVTKKKKDGGNGLPGFEGAMLLVALLAAVALGATRGGQRRRRE